MLIRNIKNCWFHVKICGFKKKFFRNNLKIIRKYRNFVKLSNYSKITRKYRNFVKLNNSNCGIEKLAIYLHFSFVFLFPISVLIFLPNPSHQLIVELCTSPSDNLISLSYLMPAFSANLFGLFNLKFTGKSKVCRFVFANFSRCIWYHNDPPTWFWSPTSIWCICWQNYPTGDQKWISEKLVSWEKSFYS